VEFALVLLRLSRLAQRCQSEKQVLRFAKDDNFFMLLGFVVSFEERDKGWDGGFGRFDGGFVSQVAEGFAGDRADGGQRDVGGEGQVGGFEEGDEISRGRCAGEGDGVGVVLG
jgi:hypothetical protein